MRLLTDTLRRFGRDRGGNVAILFGATLLPLMLIMGGAIDMARYERYKMELSNAVDSAVLALARQHPEYTAEQAKTFVTNFVSAIDAANPNFTVQNYDVQKLTNGFHVSVEGKMKTIFMPLGALAKLGTSTDSIGGNLVAEVVNSSNRVEVALVMDNTGSMNCGASLQMTCVSQWSNPASTSRIVAVKAAAKSLVDILMPDDLTDKDLVKIAIVPFEGQVNVASAGFSVTAPPSWISWADAVTGTSTWEGVNFEKRNTSTGAVCTTGTNCKYTGHKFLFNKLTTKFPTVKWAGCVEMRAGSYELSDAAPNTSVPDSLFVPFFSPDEPDSTDTTSGSTKYNNRSNGTSSGTDYTFANDYLNDLTSYTSPTTAQKALNKYTNSSLAFWSGRMDVEGLTTPYEYGPNRGCPRPIYPLANANSKAAIKTQIDSMIAYWSSGTFLPAGLVWGWHVLSPGIPYTEGTKPGDQYYSKTIKAIVFFTDGENDITDDSNPNKSRYNGYSYVASTNASGGVRLNTTTSTSIDTLDTKTATLCTNIKTNGTSSDTSDDIRLYVVTFGTISSATTTLMTDCASTDKGVKLYYHAPTTSDLADIFAQIGHDLTDIHLSM